MHPPPLWVTLFHRRGSCCFSINSKTAVKTPTVKVLFLRPTGKGNIEEKRLHPIWLENHDTQGSCICIALLNKI